MSKEARIRKTKSDQTRERDKGDRQMLSCILVVASVSNELLPGLLCFALLYLLDVQLC